jgi:hypothetical protein
MSDFEIQFPPVDIPLSALADRHGALVAYQQIINAGSANPLQLTERIAQFGEQTELQDGIPAVVAACGKLAVFMQQPNQHQPSVVIGSQPKPRDFFRFTVDPIAGVTQNVQRMQRSTVPPVTDRELARLRQASNAIPFGPKMNDTSFRLGALK